MYTNSSFPMPKMLSRSGTIRVINQFYEFVENPNYN